MSGLIARWDAVVATLPEGTLALDAPGIGGRALTHRQLQRDSRAVAAALAARTETTVALYGERGAESLAVILGALRAGRAISMLPGVAEIPEALGRALAVGGPRAAITPAELLTAEPCTEDRAEGCVVCFSSGSTGRPRAVQSSSAAQAAGAVGYVAALDLGPGDRVAWLQPLHFGASLTVAFGALVAGATLVPLPADAGPSVLRAALFDERITVLHTVPSLFRRLATAPLPPTLRRVKLGGEPAFASDLALFRAATGPDAVLFNGLGITEASGNVTWARFAAADRAPAGPRLPVGRAAPDTIIALLDDGRVAVSSPMLADGYRGDPEGTEASFKRLAGRSGRWLVTNDLGVFVNGQLEVVGRGDDVVRVRGQAVALSEVEARIAALDGVRQVAVVVANRPSEATTPKLAAFVVGTPPSFEVLRRHLPEPMWPARVVPVDALPIGDSGKVDRRALTALALEREAGRELGATDTVTRQLASIWAHALGRHDVAPDDDFFAIGGSSITAAEAIALVAEHLGVELPLAVLLEHPTPRRLAAAIGSRAWAAARAPVVLVRPGRADLAPVFVMGGRGTEVMVMLPLARHLAPLTVYCLQCDALRGAPLRLAAWREVAASFLPEVLRIQPRGPYRLVGASAGGRGMFELARLLRERGEEVELLALVDTYGPGYLRLRPGLDWRASLLALKRRIDPQSRASAAITFGALRNALRLRLGRERALIEVALGRRHPPSPRHRHGYALALADHASRISRHPPADVRVDLFRCATQPPRELAASWPELGWAGRARRGVVVHELPGGHDDMLDEPIVGLLAEQLQSLLSSGRRPT